MENKEYASKNIFSVALLRDNATMPAKRKEDAGWDIYAAIKDGNQLIIPAKTPTKVPTGLAMAFNNDYCFNMGTERSSIARHGIRSLGGLVDSGYRGEVFVNLYSEYEAIIYENESGNSRIEKLGERIYIPSHKAIAQGLFQYVPKLEPVKETYEDLKLYASDRGTGSLGSSGK